MIAEATPIIDYHTQVMRQKEKAAQYTFEYDLKLCFAMRKVQGHIREGVCDHSSFIAHCFNKEIPVFVKCDLLSELNSQFFLDFRSIFNTSELEIKQTPNEHGVLVSVPNCLVVIQTYGSRPRRWRVPLASLEVDLDFDYPTKFWGK